MARSKAARFTSAALVLAVGGLASSAGAEIHDHLKCFKVKDPSSHSATADLRPLDDTTFAIDTSCTIKVRSRELCIPVRKDLIQTDAPGLGVTGQDLTNAFLCYKVKCPSATLPATLQMSDQFGTRTLSGLRTMTVCAPAVAGTPPATTTTTFPPGSVPKSCLDATPPACDGTCNNDNQFCKSDGGGACICATGDVFNQCGGASIAPDCWGSCTGSQSCIFLSGACQCGLVFE